MGLFDKFAFFKKNNNDIAKTTVESSPLKADLISQGNQAEDRGDLDLAVRLYQGAIDEQPELPRAYLNLGNAYLKLADFDKAIATYQTALKFNPEYASAYFNIGNAYFKSGRSGESLDFYSNAIRINPDLVDAYVSSGLAFHRLERYEDAIREFKRALEKRPDYLPVSIHLSNALIAASMHTKAVDILEDALRIHPNSAELYMQMVSIHLKTGALVLAVKNCLLAAKCPIDDAEIYYNIGNRLLDLNEYESAIHCFEKSLKLKPAVPDVLINLANSYLNQNEFESAVNYYKQAISTTPNNVIALGNLGVAYKNIGQIELAIDLQNQALAIDPTFTPGLNNRAVFFQMNSQIEDAVLAYKKAHEADPQQNQTYSNYLFCLSHCPEVETYTIFNEHRQFSSLYEKVPQHQETQTHKAHRTHLKIGFVSADLKNHAVASFVEAIFSHLARNTYLTLYAYDNGLQEDDVSRKFHGYFRKWNRVHPLSDDQLADLIRSDNIDVLIDLSGHTAGNRLMTFAQKPAPVQVSWIGYPGTTGLNAIDYYFADRFFVPHGELEKQFTEKVVRLPIAVTFTPVRNAPLVNELPASKNGYITFASFNRTDKLNRHVIALWSALLRKLPNSKLILGAMPVEGNFENLRNWFVEEGIALSRLTFLQRCDIITYMAMHHQVDICLDTFPYTGGTTTNNALWMGVPTLTLIGNTAAGRQGVANLSQVALDKQFSAVDADDFIQKAIYFSEHIDELATIRDSLRNTFSESNFCKPELVSNSFAIAVNYMVERWCADLPPVPFEITDDKIHLYDDQI